MTEGTVSESAVVLIQPYHKWYENALHKLGLITLQVEEEPEPEEVFIEDDAADELYLKSLDPKDWKEQDHYAVLGLKAKRYYATEDELKKAYRKKILVHHPDKRVSEGSVVDIDSDYYSCLTKAFEILGDPTKRRSYDSVDSTFDDYTPPANNNSKQNFFAVFGPIFKRNARWSVTRPVPTLGSERSSREHVETFYNFWYNFDSWREYSYLDEEDKERGQDREERRWIEKQNKSERQKKKKEEMSRIRQLVDNAYNCDPRIGRFKEESKQKKLDQKKAKEDARKAKIEEEERVKREAEEKEKEKKRLEDVAAKAKRDQERKEKEFLKKQKRKERKQLEQIFENHNYFVENEGEKVARLQDFDRMCLELSQEGLAQFRTSLENVNDVKGKRQLFLSQVEKMLKEKNGIHVPAATAVPKQSQANQAKDTSSKVWNVEDRQLLTKAVNMFPAGTQSRWEVVATFVNQHSHSGIQRKARDVLAKVKDLQKLDPTLKQEANDNAFKVLEATQAPAPEESVPSQRYDTPAESQGLNTTPWSGEEQMLLEQALKTYPASTVDRWDRISDCINNRSKKDCIKRYKELVELVRAKKAAQTAIHTKVKK